MRLKPISSLMAAMIALAANFASGQTLSALPPGADTLDFTGRLGPLAPSNIFRNDGYFVWCGSCIRGEDSKYNRYYAIVKDFSRKERALSPQFGALALVTSEQGWGDWKPAAHSVVSLREYTDAAGIRHSLANLERPQLLFDDNNQPICLYAAGGEQDPFKGTPRFNLAIPLRNQTMKPVP